MQPLLLVVLLLLLAAPAAAQRQPVPPGPASPAYDRGWVSGGVGLGSPGGLSGVATVSYGRERVWQAGLFGAFEFWGQESSAAALQYGLSRPGRWGRVTLAAGPAYVWGRHDGSDFRTLGAVVSADAMVTPITEFGVGLNAFASVTPERPAVGLALTFVFEGNK